MIGLSVYAALALASCGSPVPTNLVRVTVTNRRPEPQKVELILQSTEPEKELQKVKGEVAANYSEQFVVPKPVEGSAPMKLNVRTADGKGITILLDETKLQKPFTVTLNRERKIEVSEN